MSDRHALPPVGGVSRGPARSPLLYKFLLLGPSAVLWPL